MKLLLQLILLLHHFQLLLIQVPPNLMPLYLIFNFIHHFLNAFILLIHLHLFIHLDFLLFLFIFIIFFFMLLSIIFYCVLLHLHLRYPHLNLNHLLVFFINLHILYPQDLFYLYSPQLVPISLINLLLLYPWIFLLNP